MTVYQLADELDVMLKTIAAAELLVAEARACIQRLAKARDIFMPLKEAAVMCNVHLSTLDQLERGEPVRLSNETVLRVLKCYLSLLGDL